MGIQCTSSSLRNATSSLEQNILLHWENLQKSDSLPLPRATKPRHSELWTGRLPDPQLLLVAQAASQTWFRIRAAISDLSCGRNRP
jgi:hypothetical protein